MKTFLLYVATAMAEIVGCYLPWLWLRQGGSIWLLLPAAASLALFAWLLTLHEAVKTVIGRQACCHPPVTTLHLYTVPRCITRST